MERSEQLGRKNYTMLASLASCADARLEVEHSRKGRRAMRLLGDTTQGSRHGTLSDTSRRSNSGTTFASLTIPSLPWNKMQHLPNSHPMRACTNVTKPCYKNPRSEKSRPVYFRTAKMKWSGTSLDEVESAIVTNTAKTSTSTQQLIQHKEVEPTPAKQAMYKEVAAAAFAGSVLSCLTFPLSSIKTQLMAGVPFGKIMHHFRISGVRRSYQGLSADLAVNLPYALLYMSVYESLKANGASRPVAAAAGAAAACLVTVPADVVTQRAQMGLTKNPFGMAAAIVKKRGVAGLYAGLPPALLRLAPNAAVQWTVYENTSLMVKRWNNGKEPSTTQNFIIGGISGSAAALATQPFDVIKTRLHTGVGYSGLLQCTQRIIKEEGCKAFMKGAVPRLLLVFPNSAIFYCTFQFARSALYSESNSAGSITESAGNANCANSIQPELPANGNAFYRCLESLGNTRRDVASKAKHELKELELKLRKEIRMNTFPLEANEYVLSMST